MYNYLEDRQRLEASLIARLGPKANLTDATGHAMAALAAYNLARGAQLDLRSDVTHLICDLILVAGQAGMDVHGVLAMAELHAEMEQAAASEAL